MKIGNAAFCNCETLRFFTFAEGSALKSIGIGAFAGTLLKLKEVNFPEGVNIAKAFGP